MKYRVISALLLLGPVLVAPAPVVDAQSERPRLEITYIANEGFFLQAGDNKVLIDALQRGGIPLYEVPDNDLLETLETAQPPFDGVNLILVSHYHRDHFTAASVVRHLQNNPEALLVSSPQVVEPVRRHLGESSRLTETLPEGTERTRHPVGTIGLEIFRLRHGESAQNLGLIVTLQGRKLLHIGDADMEAKNFAKHRLAEEEIDVAFLPYWFLLEPEGRQIVRTLIRPRQIVAMHIPPGELVTARERIRAAFPQAVVFMRQGESREF